jgi:ribonucleoside-diphosphate reductase beta chain
VNAAGERAGSWAGNEPFAGRLPDYRELYHLWEREQWEGAKIDLSLDRQQWPGLDASVRTAVLGEGEWRRACAASAMAALGAYVDTAPSEEQQVALTTQLADHARQLAFLDRFWVDVTGGESWSERRLLPTGALADLVALSSGDLVAGLGRFQLLVMGAVGSTSQRALSELLEAEDALPGLRTALDLIARDSRRHVAFALRLLSDQAETDGQVERTIRQALEEAWPTATEILNAPGNLTDPSGAEHRVGQARAALEAWLSDVGLKGALPAKG